MTWVRLLLLFLLATGAGVLFTADLSPREPREVRTRTWQESRDLHIVENIPSITRATALRTLSLRCVDPATGEGADSVNNVLRTMLPEWTAFHEDAWRRFAPRKELLKQVLQRQLGSVTLEEIAIVQDRCGAGGADPYPVSVVVEGRRVVLPVDLRDWAELFPVGDGGFSPERQLEARISRDLREGKHMAAMRSKEEP